MKFVIDKEHFKLMKKVCNKNLGRVMSCDEIDSLIYYTYAQCLKNYDPLKESEKPFKKTTKFTTYLYHSINNNSRKEYLKAVKSKEKQIKGMSFESMPSGETYGHDAFEIMDSLKEQSPEDYEILFQKFMQGMTNAEIAARNGYSRELARQKVKKALDLCRHIVYS